MGHGLTLLLGVLTGAAAYLAFKFRRESHFWQSCYNGARDSWKQEREARIEQEKREANRVAEVVALREQVRLMSQR